MESLKKIKDQLPSIIQMLNWDIKPVPNNPGLSNISNVQSLRDAVDLIYELNLFEDIVKSLTASMLFTTPNVNVRVSNAEANAINENLKSLLKLTKCLSETLDTIMPSENEQSINIKLPPVNDFEDLSTVSKSLHTALSQALYIDEVNARMKIESVENGSIWINLAIYGATSIAINLIGRLVWSATVIYKKMLEAKMAMEHIRALKIENDMATSIKQKQDEALNLLMRAEAEYVNSESFKENVPENIERLKNTIKLFAELIQKGAEIKPAINAPEEVKNLFPDIKLLPTIESKIKQITAGEGKNDQ